MSDLLDNVGYGFDFVARQHAILVLAGLPDGIWLIKQYKCTPHVALEQCH